VTSPLGTLSEIRTALTAGRISSRELVSQSLARASELQPALNAFVGFREEGARAEAEAADARRANGECLSVLDGVPVAIKDNMVQSGEPTTCASRMLEGFISPYTSTAVERLRAGGAVIIGRTNMDEFAMGSSTEHSAIGPCRNPWDPSRTSGGSSGGSAAVVAAGIVPVALGSDTGGSIRQPSAYCGVTGIKPTYGRVSRWGLVAFASSLDQIGVLARSAEDCGAVLELISGHDPRDSTSFPEPAPSFADTFSGDVSGLVIGLPREYFVADGASPAVLSSVREAVAELERAGAKTREVSLPHSRHAIATYYLIADAEASSNLARYDGVRYGHRAQGTHGLTEMYERTRSEGFGAEVKRRIVLGTYVLSAGYYEAYYHKAQQVRTLLRGDFEAAFSECDVIATPTAPEVAFLIGERTDDPLSMYLSDVYTVSANLAGIPGLSLPCGYDEGMPIGLQLLGSTLDEATPLRVADAYQRLTHHHEKRSPELV
jgi:aspartyl-tRNA(Asn)/glutamyl-tRNA(Gln) amidotransferase subunit A